MLVTAFISMWITNTATTAMMTPIMEAVLKQLDKHYENPNAQDAEIGEVEHGETGEEKVKVEKGTSHYNGYQTNIIYSPLKSNYTNFTTNFILYSTQKTFIIFVVLQNKWDRTFSKGYL